MNIIAERMHISPNLTSPTFRKDLTNFRGVSIEKRVISKIRVLLIFAGTFQTILVVANKAIGK